MILYNLFTLIFSQFVQHKTAMDLLALTKEMSKIISSWKSQGDAAVNI